MVFAIIFVVVFVRLQDQQNRIDAAYKQAESRCGTAPYLVLSRDDPIVGVSLDDSYYAPGASGYAAAQRKAKPGSSEYTLTYACTEREAQAKGATPASK